MLSTLGKDETTLCAIMPTLGCAMLSTLGKDETTLCAMLSILGKDETPL